MSRDKHPIINLEFAVESRKTTIGRSAFRRNILLIRAKNVGQLYAQYVNCRVCLPHIFAPNQVPIFGKDFEVIDGKTYYVLTKNNTRRDVLRVSENTETEGTSWFDPILPSLFHLWQWELPKNFDKSKLAVDDNIIWEVFADNAPPRNGNIRADEIDYIDYDESLTKLIKVIIRKNQLRLALMLAFILLISYAVLNSR